MERILILVMVLVAVSQTSDVRAESSWKDRTGDLNEYRLSRTSSQQGDRGSGSSRSNSMIVERVIDVRDDGLELEFDLPKETTASVRAATWQFPVRVFKPFSGPVQLLNDAELEARADEWLKSAKLTREACGRWYFTWNAFRVECDPRSAIEILAPYDLRVPDLREGARLEIAGARGPAFLTKKEAGPDGATFVAAMDLDPEVIRQGRAQAAVVAGEITKQPITLEEALRRQAGSTISGTISVTIDTDPSGRVRQRTKVTRSEIAQPSGQSETGTVTEVVERRLLPR